MKWKVHLLGTTSARSGDMFSKTTSILEAFDELWDENPNQNWSSNTFIQKAFADKLILKGVVESKLDNKGLEKFMRQKSSHYEQLKFVDSERRVRDLGRLLLTPGKYEFYKAITNGNAAFLISLLNYKINGYYLLREFIMDISRNKNMSVNDFKNNYMIGNPLSDEKLMSLIEESLPLSSYDNFNNLIPHQKGPKYNGSYFDTYIKLLSEKDPKLAFKISSKSSTKFWKNLKKLIFGTTKLKEVSGFVININEKNLAAAFLKAKLNASLEEYWNMWSINFEGTGILSTTADMIHISEDFANVVNELKIQDSTDIKSLPELFIDPQEYEEYKFSGVTLNEYVSANREREFEEYLQDNLNIDLLIKFLNNMSLKDYYEIDKFFEGSANNATYAEFLVTLAFHYISGRKMKFTDAWNGSLSADNKPLHYATGKKPDSQFYIDDKTYLIETTIQEGQQQTTNEINPISKHLFDDKKNDDKMAILFARSIFEETRRQMGIQRSSKNLIFGESFKWLANHLESRASLNNFREDLQSV